MKNTAVGWNFNTYKV